MAQRYILLRAESWGRYVGEWLVKPGERPSSQKPQNAEGFVGHQEAAESAGSPVSGHGTLSLERAVGRGLNQVGKCRPNSVQLFGIQKFPELCWSPGPALPEQETESDAVLPGTQAGDQWALRFSAPAFGELECVSDRS